MFPRRMKSVVAPTNRVLPDCWGHRGASSRFPENTLASFEAAIRDGAEGIESDVHVSADGVVLMFHDPVLNRTTDSTGQIKERVWYGEKGMQHVRTIKEPKQAIPTFAETIELLMKPENQHTKFNVDVKVQNDPDRLFKLMHEIITAQPCWETTLAPRILVGLWHPRFLTYAKERLPYCRRSYIGQCTYIARKYFWNDCDTFSISFGALTTADGQRFIEESKRAGKSVMVWTVNEPAHMMEAVRWGVSVIITDVTKTWLDLRAALQNDYEKIGSRYGRLFLWTPKFYSPVLKYESRLEKVSLEKVAGPFDDFLSSNKVVELKV
ncbi:PLC-like phosphodiesterase [Macrolepiota fuliginosa MF-IS2]|uniref:PLC-like phosphodiesterase n=1 Tax=Macrolepiota fuliginosa MF-IS2 TaxID=1400762 RepID=A0A9P5XE24_9AGAR|nr:PLC-like phosphodiesterase [Macrolepiota fuliginosa MF-IS2]